MKRYAIFIILISLILGSCLTIGGAEQTPEGSQEQRQNEEVIISSSIDPIPDWVTAAANEQRAFELVSGQIAVYVATDDWQYREHAENQHSRYTIYEILAERVLALVLDEYGQTPEEIQTRTMHYIRYLTAQAVTEHAQENGECLLHLRNREGEEVYRKVFSYSIDRSVVEEIVNRLG
ncbi:MAG: hypothetical protein ACLFR1_12895 [Spirochaetia bacterium]